MYQKQNIKVLLIVGLVAVSLGGWLLHLRIHPPFAAAPNLIPCITGIISVAVIPALFFSKKMLPFAYIINGMFVIIGAITMADVSIMRLPGNFSLETLIVGTLLADILILFTNFFIGKAVFELEMFKAMDALIRKGRHWRYPNMGWWAVHVAALSVVYTLGHWLWK